MLFGSEEDLTTVYPPISEEEESEEEEEEEEEEGKEEEEDGENESGGSVSGSRKRKRDDKGVRIPGLPSLRHHKGFYTFSSFGSSSSTLMFLLAYQLYKSNNDILWCAILGLTDQLIHNRVNQKKYFSEVDRFRKEVLELNQQGSDEEGGRGMIPGDALPCILLVTFLMSQYPDGHISVLEDFKIYLYRHWDLHQAMLHSDYVATRLKIWKPSGEQRLLTLFAKMGIPLEQCQQTYSLMKKVLARLHSNSKD